MIEKILLVARDDASADSPGFRRVLGLARGGAAEIAIVAAVYEPHLEGYLGHPELYESLRKRLVDERQDRLQRLVEAAAREGLACDARALWGHPSHGAVVAEAERGAADLLVIDAAGERGKLSHDDWQLIGACPLPLLVVRSDGTKRYAKIAAAVDPYHAHGKPQELDLEIVRQAQALQRLTSAQLVVVHAFTPLAQLAPDSFLEGVPLRDVEHAVETARRDALNALIERSGLPAESARLAEGRPDEVLRAMAERGDADLLALGTVSRGRLPSFVIGSTAQRVLRATSTDVLLTKPPGFTPPG